MYPELSWSQRCEEAKSFWKEPKSFRKCPKQKTLCFLRCGPDVKQFDGARFYATRVTFFRFRRAYFKIPSKQPSTGRYRGRIFFQKSFQKEICLERYLINLIIYWLWLVQCHLISGGPTYFQIPSKQPITERYHGHLFIQKSFQKDLFKKMTNLIIYSLIMSSSMPPKFRDFCFQKEIVRRRSADKAWLQLVASEITKNEDPLSSYNSTF